MAAVVWDLQRCTMCCSRGSLASTPGCSSFELSDVAFLAAGWQRITLRQRHGRGKQQMTLAVTRSLYSPLVESFGSFSYNMNSFSKINHSGAWSGSSPRTSPTQHHEQSGAVAYKMEEEDKTSQHMGMQPLLRNVQRSARARLPTMSLSQGFSSSGRHSVSHTVEAVGHPVNITKLPGPMGFAMAFAVAALGLKTAAEKQGFLPGTPQKVCEKCDGYGVQQCHVCQGRGVLTWEGKLRHTDPCPLCIGSCLKKCSSCGGVKMKKGMPPAIVIKL